MSDISQERKKSLAAKIRALLAKTTEAGCSEDEAGAAMAKAHELLAKYQLSLSDLDLRAEGTARSRVGRDFRGIASRLATRVARFCGCKCWQDAERSGSIHFLGLASDAQLAEWLLAALTGFVQRRTLDWSLEEGESIPNIVDSFVTGCIARINERILEEINARSATGEVSGSRALIVVKNQLVTEAFAALNLNLRKARPTAAQIHSQAAYNAGQQAGGEASFAKPTARQAGPRLLGQRQA